MAALHNPHQKAHELLQLELDGLLGDRDAGWLRAHLGECATCREYAGDLRRLDQALRLDFRTQRDGVYAAGSMHAAQALNAPAARLHSSSTHTLPGSALYLPSTRKRADMISGMFKSTANTLVSIALLAALVAGLIWLFSSMLPDNQLITGAPQSGGAYPSASAPDITHNAYPYPGVGATETAPGKEPYPAPTIKITADAYPEPGKSKSGGAYPAPAGATEMTEMTDRPLIIALLSELADREQAGYTGTTWAHQTTQDLTENGRTVIPGAFIDAWVHLVDGQCQEMIVTSSDRPDKKKLYSLIVGLSDGLSGDLVALRQGETREVQTEWTCAMPPEATDAGTLAARLKSGPEQLKVKGPNDLKSIRAWYETDNERRVMVIEAIFTAKGGTPDVQRETRRFDFETGRMTQEHIWMEWADGSPFGEYSRTQSTEFVAELPAEQAALLEQAASELQAFQQEAETPVAPASTLPVGVLDTIEQYTAATPITDAGGITLVLQALLQRHVEWLAQPGWSVHGPASLEGRKWDDTYSALLHMLPDGSCEMMTYYTKDGRILPQELTLANGDWGLIGKVEAGTFDEGRRAGQPCRPESFWSAQMMGSVIGELGDLVSGTRHTRAWTERRDGRTVLVVYVDLTYDDPKPTTMDPDTRRLEQMARSESWQFFELDNGAYAGGANQVYLVNGKVFGLPYSAETVLDMQTLHFEVLPDALQQAFDGTLAALAVYLGY